MSEIEKVANFRGEVAGAALRVARSQHQRLADAHEEITRLRSWVIELNGLVPEGYPANPQGMP